MKRLIISHLAKFKNSHPIHFGLFSSSIIIFASSILSNVLNFLFNLAAAHNLSIEHYGILQTMINIFNMINVLTILITIQLIKQFARYISKKKYSSASALVNKSNFFVIIVGIAILVSFLLISNSIHIAIGSVSSENLAIIILLSILGLSITIHKSFMKANLLFMAFALNSVFQQATKLILSIPLLILGFMLNGVILSLIISSILALAYSIWQLRGRLFFNLSEKINFNAKTFTKESFSTMIGFLGLTSIISADLILTQYYLAQQAGLYAGLAILGKGMILTTFPLNTVFLPLVINAKSNIVGVKLFKIAVSGAFVLVLSVFVIYLLIPKQIVVIALSSSYLEIIPLIPAYGMSILLYTISYIIVSGFIAMDEFTPGYVSLLVAILQVVGIFYFHSNLSDIVNVSLFANIVLAVCLIAFTLTKLPAATKKYYDKKLLPIE